jgi:hypothetical protein
MKLTPLLPFLVLAIACDKPDAPAPTASASASAAVPSAPSPPASSAASSSASPAAPPSATAPGPTSSVPTKDTVVSVFDPTKEPARTVKALAGGTVALYLPEWAGTSWKVALPDKALGKPKEETIPGFAGPSTPAHAFTWQIKDALKGQTHKVPLTNTAKAGAPGSGASFTLSIDVD